MIGKKNKKRYKESWVRITAYDEYGNLVGSADPGTSNFTLRVVPVGGCTADLQILTATGSNGVYNFSYNVTCDPETPFNLEFYLDSTLQDSTSLRVLSADAMPGDSTVLNYPAVFTSLTADVEQPFNILALDGMDNRTNILNNSDFTFVIETDTLTYITIPYFPDSPVANPVDGSALIPVKLT